MKGPQYANHIIAFINSCLAGALLTHSHRYDPGSCYKLRVTNLDKQPMYASVRPYVLILILIVRMSVIYVIYNSYL